MDPFNRLLLVTIVLLKDGKALPRAKLIMQLMVNASESHHNREKGMSEYMITYLGGNQPATPEEGKQHFAKYKQWLSSLGDAAISPANPLKGTSTVHADGSVTSGGVSTMSGFTVVEADSMEAALVMAKACPFLDIGGSLEVSELMKMPM